MTLQGEVKESQIVLDTPLSLRDGTRVEIQILSAAHDLTGQTMFDKKDVLEEFAKRPICATSQMPLVGMPLIYIDPLEPVMTEEESGELY